MRLNFARPRRENRTGRRWRRGQGLVEFALIIPILMIMLLLIIDVGRLFFGWVAIQNMARIGANFAAAYPTSTWGSGSAYQAAINSDASTINCDPPTMWPAPTFLDGGGTGIGDRVQVSLTCGFRPLTPLISAVIGNTVDLGAAAVFQIKAGVIGAAPMPTPTPTPTPTASPTGTPALCTVPNLLSLKANSATAAWKTAGFIPSNLTEELGSSNYAINSETPTGSDNTPQDCASFKITVGP